MKHHTLFLLLIFFVFLSACAKQERAVDYTNSVGMQFMKIPAGSFLMGANPKLGVALEEESPMHEVILSKSFYMGKYEVTQAQWQAVMGENPSFYQGADRPVEYVSWNDVNLFCAKLNELEGHRRYRLPTEAEWEYAARAGDDLVFPSGKTRDALGRFAWYFKNADQQTHPVGQLAPNGWGLYDMVGNVWEWTADWFDETYYEKSPETDPTGPDSGRFRVYRGSSFYWDPECCNYSDRENSSPGFKMYYLGFRVVLDEK